jgi:hypothetical protein
VLKLLLPDGWTGEVVDVSAIGLRVRSLAVLEVNHELDATLILPDERRLPVRGAVAWVDPPLIEGTPGEFGLVLSNVSDDYLEALAGFFAE